MRFARWHDSLETGYREVDEQHRALYDLVNDLNASVVAGVSEGADCNALSRILAYATNHFSAEEALMKRFEYPQMAEHVGVHERFAGDVERLVEEYETGCGTRMEQLAAFMEGWLGSHIMAYDQPLVDYLRAQQVAES